MLPGVQLGNCMGIPLGISGRTHTHTWDLPTPGARVWVSAVGKENGPVPVPGIYPYPEHGYGYWLQVEKYVPGICHTPCYNFFPLPCLLPRLSSTTSLFLLCPVSHGYRPVLTCLP